MTAALREGEKSLCIVFVATTGLSMDNNGNFICVLECTIVNLATYRQFTNAALDLIIKKKKKQKQKQTKTKQKPKKKKKIKTALSLGYPSSCFYNKRCNMLL